LDRIPPPAQEAKPEHIDFLAALRAEHQAMLAQELGTISFAQALRRGANASVTDEPTTTSNLAEGE
jgi:hypothetical protein